MDVTVTIGHWIEKAPREQVRCPGYYAADWEKHVTKPGRYALRLVFVGGYRCPMPYWVLTRIASECAASTARSPSSPRSATSST